MSSSINPLSSASYASAGIAALLTPPPRPVRRRKRWRPPSPPLQAGSVRSADIWQGRGGPHAGNFATRARRLRQTLPAPPRRPAAGASNPDPAAKAPADANAAPKASPLATLTDTAFSGRLTAAVKANDPLASIKALALLAGDLQAGTVSATAQLDAPRPGSPGAKVDEALQELAKDSDRHIASAAQSLLSKMAGVTSNGAIVYKDGSQGAQTTRRGTSRGL